MTPQDIRDFHKAVLPACREFYKLAPLNEFWGSVNERTMQELIAKAQTLTDLVHGAQKTFMFSVNVTDPVKERAVNWLLRERQAARRSTDLYALEESAHSFPGNNVEVGGRRYTPDFLRCVNIAGQIIKHTSCQAQKVVELGGGLGHLARVIRLAGLSRQHIIIDLPETLCFPEADLQLITSTEDKVREGADFVFCPVAFADPVVAGVEPALFVNTASMGEMRNETIRYWMRFIQQKLRPRFLFMLNRFLNTLGPRLEWRVQENECQQHYDRNWHILNWEIEPPYTRCPYVDTLVSRYVEIVARRWEVPEEEAKARAAALHAEVADEDWWRQRHQGHVMGMRDNPLVLDNGMDGALFKLWEMLRLDPTATRVMLMLTFLGRLNRNPAHPFEEVPFYSSMINHLRVSGRE